MITAENFQSLRATLAGWRKQGLSIGFVPTMGHLHAGHLSLIERARESCDRVVVSIFINPLQFNQASDFLAYPKTLSDDEQKLQAAAVDLLFLPDEKSMYPEGQQGITRVSVPGISGELEGACRPGHFDGVATVVNKLFNLVLPEQAFFGQKDYQQLLLIEQMVQDLNIPVQIHSVATCREADGLAMSSRNSRLSPELRRIAPKLYASLNGLASQLKQGSIFSQILPAAIAELESAGFRVEYISLRDTGLQELQQYIKPCVLLAAAWLGEVRLIDNIQLSQD